MIWESQFDSTSLHPALVASFRPWQTADGRSSTRPLKLLPADAGSRPRDRKRASPPCQSTDAWLPGSRALPLRSNSSEHADRRANVDLRGGKKALEDSC